jgi:hypothetical protein
MNSLPPANAGGYWKLAFCLETQSKSPVFFLLSLISIYIFFLLAWEGIGKLEDGDLVILDPGGVKLFNSPRWSWACETKPWGIDKNKFGKTNPERVELLGTPVPFTNSSSPMGLVPY